MLYNNNYINDNDIILELEKIFINCQHLNGLVISNSDYVNKVDWDSLFKILANSSPTSQFMFKLDSLETIKLEFLKLFFDNWKGRQSMLLQTVYSRRSYANGDIDNYFSLFEKYRAKGIIQKYDCDSEQETYSDDFEWI